MDNQMIRNKKEVKRNLELAIRYIHKASKECGYHPLGQTLDIASDSLYEIIEILL